MFLYETWPALLGIIYLVFYLSSMFVMVILGSVCIGADEEDACQGQDGAIGLIAAGGSVLLCYACIGATVGLCVLISKKL